MTNAPPAGRWRVSTISLLSFRRGAESAPALVHPAGNATENGPDETRWTVDVVLEGALPDDRASKNPPIAAAISVTAASAAARAVSGTPAAAFPRGRFEARPEGGAGLTAGPAETDGAGGTGGAANSGGPGSREAPAAQPTRAARAARAAQPTGRPGRHGRRSQLERPGRHGRHRRRGRRGGNRRHNRGHVVGPIRVEAWIGDRFLRYGRHRVRNRLERCDRKRLVLHARADARM